jgi:hypothetical protein
MEGFGFPKLAWLYHEHTGTLELYFIRKRSRTLKSFSPPKEHKRAEVQHPSNPQCCIVERGSQRPLGHSVHQESLRSCQKLPLKIQVCCLCLFQLHNISEQNLLHSDIVTDFTFLRINSRLKVGPQSLRNVQLSVLKVVLILPA